MSVPSPQMRMHSPSSTRVRGSAWVQGPLPTWVSPPVTQAPSPSCGSGVRLTDSSMWPRPCAWRWKSAPRHCPWLTVAPTSCCGGVAWTELFTPFTRWRWWSTIAKCPPNVTLLILGSEEDLGITSARSHTEVSVVFPISYLRGKMLTYCGSDYCRKCFKLSIMQLWGLTNAWRNYESGNESNVVQFSLCRV